MPPEYQFQRLWFYVLRGLWKVGQAIMPEETWKDQQQKLLQVKFSLKNSNEGLLGNILEEQTAQTFKGNFLRILKEIGKISPSPIISLVLEVVGVF
jgi:hypothetical protein